MNEVYYLIKFKKKLNNYKSKGTTEIKEIIKGYLKGLIQRLQNGKLDCVR